MSSEASSISAPSDQQVDKQTLEEEQLETLKREDKAILTPVGEVQYDVNLSTKVTVKDQTRRGDIKDSAQTCHEQVTGTNHIGNSMDEKTPIGDVLTKHKTSKRDKGHHTSIGEFRALKRDYRTSPTPQGDNSNNALTGGYKTPYGEGSITHN